MCKNATIAFELRESLNYMFITKSNLLEELNDIKNEKIKWLEEKAQMAAKIQQMELQLKSQNEMPIKKEKIPKIEPKIKAEPVVKKREIATAKRTAMCKLCNAKFTRNFGAKRHFADIHSEAELNCAEFKEYSMDLQQQWLQLNNLNWTKWIQFDGSIYGRPRKEVATNVEDKNDLKENIPPNVQVAPQETSELG